MKWSVWCKHLVNFKYNGSEWRQLAAKHVIDLGVRALHPEAERQRSARSDQS